MLLQSNCYANKAPPKTIYKEKDKVTKSPCSRGFTSSPPLRSNESTGEPLHSSQRGQHPAPLIKGWIIRKHAPCGQRKPTRNARTAPLSPIPGPLSTRCGSNGDLNMWELASPANTQTGTVLFACGAGAVVSQTSLPTIRLRGRLLRWSAHSGFGTFQLQADAAQETGFLAQIFVGQRMFAAPPPRQLQPAAVAREAQAQ